MKILYAIPLVLTVISSHAESINISCLKDEYLKYTDLVDKYWSEKGNEFKAENQDLYQEFAYLITEQKNNNRTQEITIEYLVVNHPEELKTEGALYNLVPRYSHYAQPIYRELRKNKEFSKIYFDNESFKKENKMPDFNRLQKASKFIMGNTSADSVKKAMELATKKSQTAISSLPCNS